MISADEQGGAGVLDACSLEELADRIGAAIARVVVALHEDPGASDDGVAVEVVRRFYSRLDAGLRHEFVTRMGSADWVHEGRRIARAVLHGEPWPAAPAVIRQTTAPRVACSQSTG